MTEVLRVWKITGKIKKFLLFFLPVRKELCQAVDTDISVSAIKQLYKVLKMSN